MMLMVNYYSFLDSFPTYPKQLFWEYNGTVDSPFILK